MKSINHSNNTVWHEASVTRDRREKLNQHKSVIVWFTGLSGSGKSTLAHAVEEQLHQQQCRTYVFDGDNVRHGLCADLGFSDNDRSENIRRIGEMAKLFIDAGVIALTAFISPFKADRDIVKNLVNPEDFIEIYCQCDLGVCEDRDVKGLYKKARAGEIGDFTGISSPYEEPESADLVIRTDTLSLEDSIQAILNLLHERKIIS